MFGIYGPEHDVSRLAYFALYALQHRGQESAGIAAADRGGYIITQRALGLVSQVFKEHDLRALGGRPRHRPRALLDHRLQRVGELAARPSQRRHRRQPARARAGPQRQPHQRRRAPRRAARARASPSARPRTPRSSPRCSPRIRPTTSRTRSPTCMPRLQGAFSTVVMTKDRVFAFRDPAGLRPLVLGLLGDRYCVASRDLRLRHHRRQAAARRRARRARLDRRGRASARGRSSTRRAQGVLRLRVHLLRAPRLAHGRRRRCRPRAGGWGRSWRARRRRRRPTSSSRCPTPATPPPAATPARPACPRTTASSRTATWRGRSSSPARSCASTACG